MGLLRRPQRALKAKLTRITLDQFIRSHAGTKRTLDIGAQAGPYGAYFPNRVALDLHPRPGIQIVADAQALGLASGAFDVVLCTEVLEHLPEPRQAINEMYRVLKPGGTLLLTTRFLFPIHDAPQDYFRFTKYGLRHLLRAFEIVELREETTTIGTLAVLIQRLGVQTHTCGGRFVRGLWLVAAQLVRPLSGLSGQEFGDSRRTVPEHGIMSTGYHVCATKPRS